MEGGQFGIWWCFVELGISIRLKEVYGYQNLSLNKFLESKVKSRGEFNRS